MSSMDTDKIPFDGLKILWLANEHKVTEMRVITGLEYWENPKRWNFYKWCYVKGTEYVTLGDKVSTDYASRHGVRGLIRLKIKNYGGITSDAKKLLELDLARFNI